MNLLPSDLFLSRLQPGVRVILRTDIDRWPHFIAKAGMTGVIAEFTPGPRGLLSVKLDQPLEGCEEWDNHVIWSDDDLDPTHLEMDLGILIPARLKVTVTSEDGVSWSTEQHLTSFEVGQILVAGNQGNPATWCLRAIEIALMSFVGLELVDNPPTMET